MSVREYQNIKKKVQDAKNRLVAAEARHGVAEKNLEELRVRLSSEYGTDTVEGLGELLEAKQAQVDEDLGVIKEILVKIEGGM